MLVKLALGAALVAATFVEPAVAAAPIASGIPCSGIWKLNEQLTMRQTASHGPIMQYFMPWGKNGWMRMNTGYLETEIKPKTSLDPNDTELPLWHFEQFNDKPYVVFGFNPSLATAKKITDQIVSTSRVGPGRDRPVFWIFSEDCKRVTNFKPEGEERHRENHYYNDLRVYDRIEPPDGAVGTVATHIFGGWALDRKASKLTLLPKDAETVIIVPWGNSGWMWSQLSGGYQPEDVHSGTKRVECGESRGPAAVVCRAAMNMMLYWATWDSKPFPTHGSRPLQVQLKRISDNAFEASLFKAPQTAALGDKASVVFSPDGRRMTVTTKSGATSGANRFEDDVRVYARIDDENLPSVTP